MGGKSRTLYQVPESDLFFSFLPRFPASHRVPSRIKVVDTGSSNLAVAGPALGLSGSKQVYRTYDPDTSNSSQKQPDTFEVEYVQGDITGFVYEDKV